MSNKTFIVDEANSDDERFYVDVSGLGSVCIAIHDEGVAIDMYSLDVRDEAVASTYAFNSELIGEEPE